jgi:hypothetical protein
MAFVRFGLKGATRFLDDRAAKSQADAQQKIRRAASIESLESRQLLSTSWFVSPSGSNGNPGTLAAPFQTIQAAANVAKAGDHVEIETGTYHETVTPKASGTATAPIIFEAYNGESVTVSGADPIIGWSNYSGSIYKASMPWDLGEGNNEVFVDGQAMNEARWPNTSLDLSHPTLAKATSVTRSGSTVTLYNASLSQAANFWKGAIIHIMPGQEWVPETDAITSSGPGWIKFNFVANGGFTKYSQPSAGNHFYLTNSFKSLDSAGEWYRDPTTGTLYLETPNGSSPAGHDVEAKHRQWAFDLTGKAYITIHGISIFSASINTNSSSTGTVINGIHATYIGQFLTIATLWAAPSSSGIVIRGANSLVENSTIAYGAGDGILVFGAGSRITNNTIHDVDYSGSDCAAIRVYASGALIDHNTIYNTGRDAIKQQAPKLQVLNNLIHDIGLQVTEAGAVYTAGFDGQGTVIAYNDIYNMHSGGYGQTALFLDNNSSNYTIHNNIVSNVDIALKINFVSKNNNIYNNTLNATQYTVYGDFDGSWHSTTFANNVFLHTARFGSGVTLKNNVFSSGIVGTGAGDFSSGAT